MSTEQLALVHGWDDTRATLRRWRARPLVGGPPVGARQPRRRRGAADATWVVAMLSMPDPTVLRPDRHSEWGDFGFILYRNGLVLALHAMACVAGFMAGSSLPIAAEGYSGWWRRVHDRAGKLAIGVRRRGDAVLARHAGVRARAPASRAWPTTATSALHCCWSACCPTRCRSCARCSCRWPPGSSRAAASAWNELLAATFVTTAIAVPVLLAAAAVEVWVSPHVLYFLK